MAARAARRAADQRGSDLPPPRIVDSADAPSRSEPGHHRPVQDPGAGDGGNLDRLVQESRGRPLDAEPYAIAAANALTTKVREDGRVVKFAVTVGPALNADGYRDILGVTTYTADSPAPSATWSPRPSSRRTGRATGGWSRTRPDAQTPRLGHASRASPRSGHRRWVLFSQRSGTVRPSAAIALPLHADPTAEFLGRKFP